MGRGQKAGQPANLDRNIPNREDVARKQQREQEGTHLDRLDGSALVARGVAAHHPEEHSGQQVKDGGDQQDGWVGGKTELEYQQPQRETEDKFHESDQDVEQSLA